MPSCLPRPPPPPHHALLLMDLQEFYFGCLKLTYFKRMDEEATIC